MSQLGRFRRLLGLGRSDERRQRKRVDARKGLKVLIIDDSRTVVAALSHMLRQSGYVPFGASDGEKGLELAVSEQPDLVFLDIVLPGLNGFAALRRLRKDPRTANIPVIMISGNPQAAEKFYLERIGADDFMKKPFGRAEVFTRIEKLVRGGELPARVASTPMDPPPVEAQTDANEVRIHDAMAMDAEPSESNDVGRPEAPAPTSSASEASPRDRDSRPADKPGSN